MRYRATENINLPFKVHAIVNEVNKTKVEYSIAVRANYGSKLFATNVVIKIPTPLNTARISERVSQGKAKYEPSENNIVWKIQRFSGQSEYVLNAEAELTSMTNQKAWSRPPLSVNFSLLMFTSSGLLVRYLKVFEKGNYSSVKWVRYMTRGGEFVFPPGPATELGFVDNANCYIRRIVRSPLLRHILYIFDKSGRFTASANTSWIITCPQGSVHLKSRSQFYSKLIYRVRFAIFGLTVSQK